MLIAVPKSHNNPQYIKKPRPEKQEYQINFIAVEIVNVISVPVKTHNSKKKPVCFDQGERTLRWDI